MRRTTHLVAAGVGLGSAAAVAAAFMLPGGLLPTTIDLSPASSTRVSSPATHTGTRPGPHASTSPSATRPRPATRPPRPGTPKPRPGTVTPRPASVAPSTPTPQPSTRSPRPAVIARLGATGETVRTIQARLGRLGLLAVEPTGCYGTMTTTAVTTFQRHHGLPATGEVDQTTWDALARAAATVPEPSKKPTPRQPRAPSSPPRSTTPPATHLDARCRTGRVLCINKTTRRLYWVIDGRVIDDWSVRTGRPGMDTREGTFGVYLKDRKSWSKLYHVWMPYSMYFSGGQAVHYSEEFAQYGYSRGGSHGCVNMRDHNGIAWLFSQVRVGDKVVVHR